jgi:hypothetical protein
MAQAMTHAELLAEVLELAAARGVPYIVAHSTKSTPGATDLVLIGPTNVAFVEIKSQDGRRERPQIAFADRLEGNVVGYFLWRPSDLEKGTVDEVLTRLGKSSYC